LNGWPRAARRTAPEHGIVGYALGNEEPVASTVGGATGLLLSQAARSAFMSGAALSLAVGAVVALAGALLVVVALPSRTHGRSSGPGGHH
jgi:hypothetical protein